MKKLILTIAIFGFVNLSAGLNIEEYQKMRYHEECYSNVPYFLKQYMDEQLEKYEKEAQEFYPESPFLRWAYRTVKSTSLVSKLEGEKNGF